jgi:hypothetical protein
MGSDFIGRDGCPVEEGQLLGCEREYEAEREGATNMEKSKRPTRVSRC